MHDWRDLFCIASNEKIEKDKQEVSAVPLSMNIIRYVEDDKSTYTSSQVLNFIRSNLLNVGELHFEGSFSDRDVVDLCQIFLNNPAQVNLRALHLPSNELSIISAHALARVLSTNTSIVTLDLRHNELGPEGVEALIQPLVSENKTLKSLILKNNKLSHRVASCLSILLNRNETLEELHLGHNAIGVKGIKVFAPMVRRRLKKLHLAHNRLKAHGMQLLAKELQGHKHELVFLDLTCNQIGEKGMQSLSEWLLVRQETKLQHLWLGSNNLGPSCGCTWASILEYNSTLVEIRLGGNNLGDRGTVALSRGLESNYALQRLELEWNQTSDEGGIALAQALRRNGTLKMLDLSGNQIAQRGCIALAEALPYHLELKELNMTNNLMTDEAAEAFASSLTERHCVFEKLHWEENSLSQDAVKNLEHATQYRKNLKRWLTPQFVKQIQQNRISCLNWMCKESISDFEVTKLASLLLNAKDTRRLTIMYLGGIEISSKGIEALSEWIGSSSCSLTRLFIRSTSMGDKGARAIADALETNTSLRELSLTGSNITAVGAASLGRALVENDTLSRLSLAHNRIGVEGVTALARGIQQAMAITSLNVMSNKIEIPKNSDLWDALVQTSIRELTLRDNSIDDDVIVELAHSLRDECPFQKLDFVDNKITKKGAWLLSKLLEEHDAEFHY